MVIGRLDHRPTVPPHYQTVQVCPSSGPTGFEKGPSFHRILESIFLDAAWLVQCCNRNGSLAPPWQTVLSQDWSCPLLQPLHDPVTGLGRTCRDDEMGTI
jgi:hypothetical protein